MMMYPFLVTEPDFMQHVPGSTSVLSTSFPSDFRDRVKVRGIGIML